MRVAIGVGCSEREGVHSVLNVALGDPDTDGDGLTDPQESCGTDPGNVDSDGDVVCGMVLSLKAGTNPLLSDTDGDGYTDERV